MSRIGKSTILIPTEVSVSFKNEMFYISGKYGKFEHLLDTNFSFTLKNNKLSIINTLSNNETKKLYGLNRSLIANKVLGVSKPYEKILIAQGVGYKFQKNENKINLNVGFSHLVEFQIPDIIFVTVESNTKLVCRSIDKELLGQFCSRIRAIRPPEPYKGKGIKYETEIIARKVGKAGK
jgi:large subunit ribosomal protein L6